MKNVDVYFLKGFDRKYVLCTCENVDIYGQPEFKCVYLISFIFDDFSKCK